MPEEEQLFSRPQAPQPRPPQILDVSWATIVKIILALTSLYLVFLVRDILIWFVFALIISILFNPAINFLRKLKIPRVLAAILVYLSLFILLGFLIYLVSPLLFDELQRFSSSFPQYFDRLAPYFSGLKIEALKNFQSFSNSIGQTLSRASLNIFTAVASIFGGLLSTLVIFTIAFFLSLEERGVARIIRLATPAKYKNYVISVWKKSQRKVASWFGVRIICCIFIGLVAGITVYVLNIPYAAFFGLLAGVANLIVFVGSLVSGLVITLFILAIGGFGKALIFVIAFFIAQEIEAYILMPVLTKKLLRLSPSLVLISLLVGAKLWGLLGAILAIPLVGMFYEFVKGFLERAEAVEQQEKNLENA